MTKLSITPSLYIGTYKKYNNNNLSGEWLNLEDYNDFEEFIKACKELHSDENDPEFMIQDAEDIHSSLAKYLDKDLYTYLEACKKSSPDIVNALLDYGYSIEQALEDCEAVYMIEKHHNLTFEENIAYYHADNGFIEGLGYGHKETIFSKYFDYQSYGHDENINGTYIDIGDTILWIHN